METIPHVRHQLLDSNQQLRRNKGDSVVATSRLLSKMALLRERANNACLNSDERKSGRNTPPCAEHLAQRGRSVKAGDPMVEKVLRMHLAHATPLTAGVGRPQTAKELTRSYAEQLGLPLYLDARDHPARPRTAEAHDLLREPLQRPHAGIFVSAHAAAREGGEDEGGEALRFVPEYEDALRRHLEAQRTPQKKPKERGGYLMRKPPAVRCLEEPLSPVSLEAGLAAEQAAEHAAVHAAEHAAEGVAAGAAADCENEAPRSSTRRRRSSNFPNLTRTTSCGGDAAAEGNVVRQITLDQILSEY